MSLASLHPAEMLSHDQYHSGLLHRSASIGSSMEELQSYFNNSDSAVLSIEDLHLQLNSCLTCGVSWQEQHVSLDCSECGGYSMERPCPLCEGQCEAVWKRDLATSHASGKACWVGECASDARNDSANESDLEQDMLSSSGLLELETARLCARLEKMSA